MFQSFALYTSRPGYRKMAHLLFWLVLLIVRLYLTLITFNVYSGLSFSIVFLLNLNSTLLIAAVFYLMTGPLWKLLQRRQYFYFTFYFFGLLCGYTLIEAVAEQALLRTCSGCLLSLQKGQPQYFALVQSGLINIVLKRLLSLGTPFGLLLTLSIPLCLKLAVNAWRSQLKALQLAKDNLELEFNFLKAQLNPHFLFNSMNNIYGLILQGDQERSAGLVARLSEMLRYMLYESNEAFMPLQSEIKLIQNYIELEKVRLNDTGVIVNIAVDSMTYEIPPLLLMPLVENAFKFSPDEPGARIHFFLDVTDGRLRFTSDNVVDHRERMQQNGGIGLGNLKKRLEMYYPGKYWYEDNFADGVYNTILSIELT